MFNQDKITRQIQISRNYPDRKKTHILHILKECECYTHLRWFYRLYFFFVVEVLKKTYLVTFVMRLRVCKIDLKRCLCLVMSRLLNDLFKMIPVVMKSCSRAMQSMTQKEILWLHVGMHQTPWENEFCSSINLSVPKSTLFIIIWLDIFLPVVFLIV